MSGGKDRKSRSSKAQGWEEAGGEFYQESYPGDLENLQRDPAALATLLPSKQNRAATTRRVRPNQQDTKNTRRRPGTATGRRRSSQQGQQLTANRRNSQYADVQVSMLPDLSQDLTDEERIWEEIMEIKTMPVSMAQKREMKAQLQNTTTLRLKGLDQFKWQRRKFWQQFLTKWSEFINKMELWRYSLKRIEGNFGTGVVAYFLFLRWLMFLNLVIFILIFSFVVIPHTVLREPKDIPCNISEKNSTQCCFEDYMSRPTSFSIWDILQGTGFMERTLMFYGNYTNKIFGYHPYENLMLDRKFNYNTINDNYNIDKKNFNLNVKNVNNNQTNDLYKEIISSDDEFNSNDDLLQQLTENSTGSDKNNLNLIINERNLNISKNIFNNMKNSSHIKLHQQNNHSIDKMPNAAPQIRNFLPKHEKPQTMSEYVSNELYYDLPLAYISITAVYFLISLAAIVKSASREFKDRLVDGEGQFYQYCNLIFGGWDFCIHNEKSADIKHKALFNEITSLLYSKRMEYERHNRSRDYMCKLIMIRLVVNIFVIIILALSAYLIFYLFNVSLNQNDLLPNSNDPNNYNENIINEKRSDYISDPLIGSLILDKNASLNLNNKMKSNSDEPSFLSINSNNEILQKDHNNQNMKIENEPIEQISSQLSSSSLSKSEEKYNYINKKYSDEYYDDINDDNRFIGKSGDTERLSETKTDLFKKLQTLFYEFLPYIAIVCLNLFVPIVFNYLCEFEQYSPMFVIKISLLRTVFLRLSSLAVLLSRFYFIIIPNSDNECIDKPKASDDNQKTQQCWETFVGQQFYKLVITDFVTHIVVTFFVNFPRSLIAKHINTKFARLVGEQEFELTKHVLDVVYSQTLCWLGTFYAPFLPLIATVLTFFMFYIKKFQCLVNSKPSIILYRASRSNSLFMFILLLSFAIAVVPVVYAIAEIRPSRSCGPFRGLNSVWDAAIESFMKMPLIFQNFIFFLGTAGFAIPCFIVLTLFLYYYYAVSDANKHMVEVLKNQLVLEGHDKQFLLNRLSSFIKQQQEFQKKMRQYDPRIIVDTQGQQTQQQQSQSNRDSRDHRSSRERNRIDAIGD